MFETEEEFFNFLIENEIITLYGMTNTDEVTYAMNLPKLKEFFPEMYQMVMEDMDDTLLDLYKKNLIAIEYDENLNVKYGLTKEAHEILIKQGYDITLGEDNG